MPSELETAARQFRNALLTNERAAASEMVRAYGASWQRVNTELRGLQAQIDAARAAGLVPDTFRPRLPGGPVVERTPGTFSPSWLYERDRLSSLQRQIEAEMRQFSALATDLTEAGQLQAVRAGIDSSQALLELATQNTALATVLDRLPVAAVQELVGFASDGSPLRALFDALGPDVSAGIRDALATAVATGMGPRETARLVRRQYGMGLARALRIARTEQIRAYREATHQNYLRNADVLEGWIWLSAANRRTCAACWAMHGTFHELSERLDDHPQGRCVMVPAVKGRRPAIPTGNEEFAKLSEDDQRAILGPAAFDAWTDGQFAISDMARMVHDPRWGDSVRRKTLAELGVDGKKRTPRPATATPTARKAGPSGTPVSAAADIQATGKVKTNIEEMLEAIDSVHGDGTLDQIPFKKSAGERTLGEYSYSGSRAKQIKVSSKGEHPQLTTAHEVGHWLDHQQINIALRNPRVIAAMQADPQLAAALKDAKDKYWDTVYASKYYDDLKNLKTVRGLRKVYRDGEFIIEEFDAPVDRRYLRYLTSSDELWARSYAQYIAERGNSAIMKDELEQSLTELANYPQQWPHGDFEPIADAIDGIMAVLGWRQ